MKPYLLGHDEGDAIWMFDALDTIKADSEQTGGGFSLIEFQDYEGSTVPVHQNERWDRGFYVVEGEYTFYIGEDDRNNLPPKSQPDVGALIPTAAKHGIQIMGPPPGG